MTTTLVYEHDDHGQKITLRLRAEDNSFFADVYLEETLVGSIKNYSDAGVYSSNDPFYFRSIHKADWETLQEEPKNLSAAIWELVEIHEESHRFDNLSIGTRFIVYTSDASASHSMMKVQEVLKQVKNRQDIRLNAVDLDTGEMCYIKPDQRIITIKD